MRTVTPMGARAPAWVRRRHVPNAARGSSRRTVYWPYLPPWTLRDATHIDGRAHSRMRITASALSAGRVLSRLVHQIPEQPVQPRLACVAPGLFGGLDNVGPKPRVGERERNEHERTGTGSKWSQSHETSPQRLDKQVPIGSTSERRSRRTRLALGGAHTVRGFGPRRSGPMHASRG